ncbi:MAG: hypothetical protein ACRDD1_13615, partial [Planctomycetia bacterium]
SAYLLKLDVVGNFQWVVDTGVADDLVDGGSDVSFSDLGRLYYAGGRGDVVIGEVNPNDGSFLFSKSLTSDSPFAEGYVVYGISSDRQDNIYVAGSFDFFNSDFDPGPATAVANYSGGRDGFVLKLNETGQFQWVAGAGGSSDDVTRGVAGSKVFPTTTRDGGTIFDRAVVSAGSFQSFGSFDPTDFGFGGFLFSRGRSDAFFLTLNNSTADVLIPGPVEPPAPGPAPGTPGGPIVLPPVPPASVFQNSAPTLDASGTPRISALRAGTAVRSLVQDRTFDRNLNPVGVAVIGITNNRGGRWQFSVDGGESWRTVASPSNSRALLLSANARLRFLPASGSKTGRSQLIFRAWDQTVGRSGQYFGITQAGGSSAFSSVADSAFASFRRRGERVVNNGVVRPSVGAAPSTTTGRSSANEGRSTVLAADALDAVFAQSSRRRLQTAGDSNDLDV